jgi:decaprenylphospho-beta-D-erythro-pentofuranosid-2-ulose 2-reductase
MKSATSTVLILGAASDIGMAIAREYAKAGCSLILAARDHPRLAVDAEDIRIRFQGDVTTVEWDVLSSAGGADAILALPVLADTVICVVGLLGDQAQSELEHQTAEMVMRTNYLGPALVLGEIANRMQQRGSGSIIGISSVAGDRGRASNYIYGSAKAGFTAFLSGLRNRLARSGVRVLTVKPGFVNTRMTAGMPLPKPLTAQPDEVARSVLRADLRRKNEIYVRPIWFIIMLIIRNIPESIFKKMKI